MGVPSRQIGWGTEENLLWGISKQLENLIEVTYNSRTTAELFNPLFTDVSGTTAGAVATGSYTMLAPKICFFRVRIEFDTCTNFGTGQYQITLPFPSTDTMRQANGTLHQTTGGALYHIAGIVDSDTAPSSIMKLYYSGSTTDLNWKFNTPVGGTTVTSHFDISGTYEIV